MTAPMTAAEYREANRTALGMYPGGWTVRILAALEEREALLGKLARATRALTRLGYTDCGGEEWKPPVGDRSDASVGALVRRIREEKPFAYLTWSGSPVCFALDKNGLTFALDSLLPKEPEVAPSGWRYEPGTHPYVRQIDHEGGTLTIRRADSDAVPPCDREFVARLLEASNAH
jgi:hypothetical protein